MWERLVDIFPVAYLTLMAIIQGAAFGILFLTVREQIAGPIWSLYAATLLIRAFAVGLVAVIVTHEYLLLAAVVRWVPTVFDTLIPYLLGFGEIWMALAIGHATSWWAAVSALCGVAVFAFLHTRARATEGSFGDAKDLYIHNRKAITRQIILCMVMLLGGTAIALLNSRHELPMLLDIGLTLVFILTGIAVLVLGERNQNVFYDTYHLPRWPLRQ